MATHSSVLAWRIPGTGEPGGLPSMGSQSRTRLKRLSSSSSSSQFTSNFATVYYTMHWAEWKQCQTLFFWAPKSLQMVIAAMKLKDAYSLEGKL